LNLERGDELNSARGLGEVHGRQTAMPGEQIIDHERVSARQQLLEEQLLPRRHSRRESRHQGIQLAELSAIAPAGGTARRR